MCPAALLFVVLLGYLQNEGTLMGKAFGVSFGYWFGFSGWFRSIAG